MQNQYEEIIRVKPCADIDEAVEFIKKIYTAWLPEKNLCVTEHSIKLVANGEQEFGQLSNASLDFGEHYGFRAKYVESWNIYYRDEPEENTDLTEVHEEWRRKSRSITHGAEPRGSAESRTLID